MKKIFVIIIAASMMLVGVEAFAQVSVGAGWVNSTLTTKTGDVKTNPNSNGFYLGASYNLSIAEGFGLAPGLYYEFLGGKNSFGGELSASSTTTEHYLDVPVMFNYGFELAPDCKLFAFAGPTLQFGLASNVKYKAGAADINAETKISNYDGDYGRFDCLIGGGVGFQISAIQIKVGYNYGLVNRYTGGVDNLSTHRSAVHIGVGYAF